MGVLDEIYEFLDYLARNEYNEDARKEENLKKKFGEDAYRKIYSLIGGKKTGMLPKKEGDKKIYILHINDEGIKFLEEQKQKKIIENNAKTTIFLTSILVLTTIANFFNQLNLINKWTLMIIYAIFSVLLIFYFKGAKVIGI